MHEALCRVPTRRRAETHARRDRALHAEGQPLLAPARLHVQVPAHRPEEALGPAEAGEFGRREQALCDEVVPRGGGERAFADPDQRMEIAERPLAVLDVRLGHVTPFAELGVTG